MKLLELFCGTKSVGKVAETMGYDEIITLDFDPRFNATHTVDIFEWDYKQYPNDYFDTIWASPDCTTWSLASGGKYRTLNNIYGHGGTHQEKAEIGNTMILKVIEILMYFQPNKWYMENPRGMLKHYPPLKDFIEDYGFMTTVFYANYDHPFPKPTDIWSNLPLWEKEKTPIMGEDTYIIKPHIFNGRPKKYYKEYYYGKGKASIYRSIIPPTLIRRLLDL